MGRAFTADPEWIAARATARTPEALRDGADCQVPQRQLGALDGLEWGDEDHPGNWAAEARPRVSTWAATALGVRLEGLPFPQEIAAVAKQLRGRRR